MKGRVTADMRKRWDHRIEFLLEYHKHMSDWEVEFVDSLSMHRSNGENLSMKQSAKLTEVFHRIEERVG